MSNLPSTSKLIFSPTLILLLVLLSCSFITSINSLKIHDPSRHSKQLPITYNNVDAFSKVNINYKYYDNLQSKHANFFYGSITKQAYEMRVKLYKLDDYQQCGSDTPFAAPDMQSCLRCPQQRPLFDLGIRECERCRVHITDKCDEIIQLTHPQMVPNKTTGNTSSSSNGSTITNSNNSNSSTAENNTATATTNVTADSSSSINNSSNGSNNNSNSAVSNITDGEDGGNNNNNKDIEANTNNTTTQRSTDKNSPHVVVWTPNRVENISSNNNNSNGNNNNANNSSSVIDTSSDDIFVPVPIDQSGSSSNNNNNNSSSASASNNSGGSNNNYTGPTYRVTNNTNNNNANSSATTTTNNTTTAKSQIRDKSIYFDSECPLDKPYHNATNNECQACAQGYEYIPLEKKCLPIIHISNPMNKYVILSSTDQIVKENQQVRKQNPTRTLVTCPLERPIATNGNKGGSSGNGNGSGCFGCSEDKLYDYEAQECKNGCPTGKVFNIPNSRCIQATFTTNPDAPSLLSPINNYEQYKKRQQNKISSSNTILKCPIITPYFIKGKCQICPFDKPLFNVESEQCENCSRGRYYHAEQRKCLSDYDTGIEVKRMVPNII